VAEVEDIVSLDTECGWSLTKGINFEDEISLSPFSFAEGLVAGFNVPCRSIHPESSGGFHMASYVWFCRDRGG